MSSLNFDLIFDERDFPEYEVVNKVIRGISKILEYQLFSELDESWVHQNTFISVYYYSPESIQTLKPFNDLPRLNAMPLDGGITLQDYSDSDEKVYFFRKKFDANQFRDLAAAEIEVDEGIPFALVVYDINKVEAARIQEVRNILLDMYYESLKQVAQCIDLDVSILEKAYQSTKNKKWFIEQEVGEIVCSRGKTLSKAQLIARWEPDYIFHSARIFEDDGSSRDILFMIYWRLVSGEFFNAPGRLSWVNKNTLKFIPNYRDEYRLVFDVNKGPIDFSYYFEPPRSRATKFYDHLLTDDEPYERKILYLN